VNHNNSNKHQGNNNKQQKQQQQRGHDHHYSHTDSNSSMTITVNQLVRNIQDESVCLRSIGASIIILIERRESCRLHDDDDAIDNYDAIDDGCYSGVAGSNHHHCSSHLMRVRRRTRSKLRVSLHDYINAMIPSIREGMMCMEHNCSHDSRPGQQMNDTSITTVAAAVVRINKRDHDVTTTIEEYM